MSDDLNLRFHHDDPSLDSEKDHIVDLIFQHPEQVGKKDQIEADSPSTAKASENS